MRASGSDSGSTPVVDRLKRLGGRVPSARSLVRYLPVAFGESTTQVVRGLQVLGLVLLLPLLAWLMIVVMNLSISLSSFNEPLAQAFSRASGRTVSFAGDTTLVPSLVPSFELKNVSVANPEGRDGEFLRVETLRFRLDLWSLLFDQLVIESLELDGVRLNLEGYEGGDNNWRLGPAAGLPAGEDGGDADGLALSADIQTVTLTNGWVGFSSADSGAVAELSIEALHGALPWAGEISLEGNGAYQDIPWQGVLWGNTLQEFLGGSEDWQVKARFESEAGYVLLSSLEFAAGAFSHRLELQAEDVRSLSSLVGGDLPDLGPIQLSGVVRLGEGSMTFEDASIDINGNVLGGKLDIVSRGSEREVLARLSGEWLQLARLPQSAGAMSENLRNPGAAPFTIDAELNIDRFVLGTENLGQLHARLQWSAGRLELSDFRVSYDEGYIAAAGELSLEAEEFNVRGQLQVEQLDYGRLVRQWWPQSTAAGTIDLKLGLEAESDSFDEILADGSGYLDLGLWPDNFTRGSIPAWPAGLVTASVEQFEPVSELNCLAARFELDAGHMEERTLMVDTRQFRLLGDAEFDLDERSVDLVLMPKKKKAKLIDLDTPVQLVGNFDDFEPRVKDSDFAYSVVRTGMNIVLLGIPLLFHTDLQEDGSADCHLALNESARLSRK